MSNLSLRIDDQVMDELVSGSLRGERYKAVLLALEAEPQLWRRCALAFLEEQALTQDLTALTAGNIDWSPSTVSTESAKKALVPDPGPLAVIPATRVLVPSGQKVLLQRFGVLAALLFLSFAIGWMGAGFRSGDSANDLVGGSTQAGILGTNQSLQMPIAGDVAGSVPAVPNSAVFSGDQFKPMDPALALQLRQLEAAGRIRIETIEAIVPVKLEDGSSVIVPVQQYRIIPVAHAY